jgi:hypothetical protein
MMALLAVLTVSVAAAQQPHVYINPGHGGYDSDDRNVVVYPFHQGDTAGSWESKSNLRKGLALKEILEKKGYRTSISRVTNTTSDDLALSTIVALCNQSGADVFYSVHSNATGTSSRVNYPMAFYRGYTGTPQVVGADVLAATLELNLYPNRSTVWTHSYQVWGDWSFRPEWGTQGYGVLRGNQAVAVLSEGSFHDYIPEAYRLLSPSYCWMEGWNISLGADLYFGRQYPLGVVTGNVRDESAKRLQEGQAFVVFGDDDLRPIHNATVRLIDAAGNEVQRCMTDTLRNGIYLFKYVEPGSYTVEVSTPSHYTQSKTVTVTANGATYQNFFLKEAADKTPAVVDYSPVWHEGDEAVMCNTPVTLTFNWDMDSASTCEAFSLEPSVSGTFAWEDDYRRLVFRPVDAFDVNTLYTVTLKKSAKQSGGTPMAEDFTMQFYTQSRNHLVELAVFPYEGAQVHLTTPTVELRVDSLLETYNLFQRLRVLDSEGNEIPWNKRSIKYNKRGDGYGFVRIPLVRDIEAGKDYQLILDADIADTAGIHLPAQRVINFTGVDAGADKPGMEVVEDFAYWEEHPYLGPGSNGYASWDNYYYSPEDLLDGALVLDYHFTNANGVLFLSYAPDWGLEQEEWDRPFVQGDKIGIHVWGDMSYNELSLKFWCTSEHDYPVVPLCKIDFHGWRYLEVNLNDFIPDAEYLLKEIELRLGSELMGKTGTLKLDDIVRGKTSGVDEARLAGMRVRVAGDYIVVSADTWVQGVELLDVNGRTIKAAGGNCLNVADVASGVYLLRVIINGAAVTQKVRL